MTNLIESGGYAGQSKPALWSLTLTVFMTNVEGAVGIAGFASQASVAAPGARFPNRRRLWACPGRGSPCWAGAGAVAVVAQGAHGCGCRGRPCPAWSLPGHRGSLCPGDCGCHGNECSGYCYTTLVHAQAPLLLSELWFYSIGTLICFWNKLVIEHASVSAFHGELLCT